MFSLLFRFSVTAFWFFNKCAVWIPPVASHRQAARHVNAGYKVFGNRKIKVSNRGCSWQVPFFFLFFFLSFYLGKHCTRNSVLRNIFVQGFEVNPWTEVLNEMNQNGFCSQIPARSGDQTELWNSFKSWINSKKTAVCSEHISEQHKMLIASEKINHSEFPPTINSFTSPCSNPLGETLSLVKPMEILAVIWLWPGFCPKSFHELNKMTTWKYKAWTKIMASSCWY